MAQLNIFALCDIFSLCIRVCLFVSLGVLLISAFWLNMVLSFSPNLDFIFANALSMLAGQANSAAQYNFVLAQT